MRVLSGRMYGKAWVYDSDCRIRWLRVGSDTHDGMKLDSTKGGLDESDDGLHE
jgi:hypothetical protein